MTDFSFNSHRYDSPVPGTRLIITGAVHGNETCGTVAIRRLIDELATGKVRLIAGHLTLVPVTNPLAFERGQRQGERNLNRRLLPTSTPTEFEDHVANWLCPLLAAHDVLLDLHSFVGDGEPFVMIGPQNNTGILEPFQHAQAEWAMAVRVGVSRLVDGWLSTYARGVTRRQQRLSGTEDASVIANAGAQFGVGTTEYMRSVGGYGVTLECGSHTDPRAPDVAYRAIINTLTHLGLIAGSPPVAQEKMESLRIYDVIDRYHQQDRLVRNWQSFDAIELNELIAVRYDGTELRAELAGRIIFPDDGAAPGEEWFYVTRCL
ncbi:succinylglutamate desuccinylase [Undibacterium sp. RuRC25W]|uniref:succinylglutamate desuccinylase n=1 Tax=Undibacterium sp. RuRC25W TaxID=3413047 RepID=UPI003BEF725F